MTREEAKNLVRALLAANAIDSEGLNDAGLGGAMFSEQTVYFEHPVNPGALKASVLLYRFRATPRPEILSAIQREAASGAPLGGGVIDFREENFALLLSRSFESSPGIRVFGEAVGQLLLAGQEWSEQILERVADTV